MSHFSLSCISLWISRTFGIYYTNWKPSLLNLRGMTEEAISDETLIKLVMITSTHWVRSICWELVIAICQDHTMCFSKLPYIRRPIRHIHLEIPEVEQMCSILLLPLLRALKQETHPSFYKWKTHTFQVICSGRTLRISLWYKRKMCFTSLSKMSQTDTDVYEAQGQYPEAK